MAQKDALLDSYQNTWIITYQNTWIIYNQNTWQGLSAYSTVPSRAFMPSQNETKIHWIITAWN